MDIERRWHELFIRAEGFDLEGRQSCGVLVPVDCGNGVCCPPASTCVAAGSGSNCRGPIGGITVPGLTVSAPGPAATSTAAPLPPTSTPPPEASTSTVVLPPPTTFTTLTVLPPPSSSAPPSAALPTVGPPTPPAIPLPTSSTGPTSLVSLSSIALPSLVSTFSTSLTFPSSSAGSTSVAGGVEGSPTASTGSTGAAVSVTPITNGATGGGGSSGERDELSTADLIGIAVGGGTAIVLLIILAAAAVITWRRKSARRNRPRDSDALPITREISQPRQSLHTLSYPDDVSNPCPSLRSASANYSEEENIQVRDEPWAISGAQPTTAWPAEDTRGSRWFQLPMPVLAHSSLGSTFSRPGPATSLHSHPLTHMSTAPSIPRTSHNARVSGGVPRVVRKPSSTTPPHMFSHSSDSVDRRGRVSDSESIGTLTSEAERRIAEGDEGFAVVEGGRDFNVSQRGSGSSSDERQRQPVNFLPVFQKPLYVQLPGSSGAIVELI